MLTLGYIGNGKSTNRYHIPFVLQRNTKFTIKSIYERSLTHRRWKTVEGVCYTSNVEDILNDEDIDIVVICTNQDSHFSYAKLALAHKKHVLVEKPFMMTLQQTKEIFAYARTMGKHIECFQNRRYDSDFLTMCQVLQEGKLGEVYEVEMHFDYYRPQLPQKTPYSRFHGFLYGHGCHTIDQVVSYFGIPHSITYQVKRLCGDENMNDYFDLDLFYQNHLKVSVKSSYFRIKSRPSFIVYGKRGMFVKQSRDRQEEDLKKFYMPCNEDFGLECMEDYGILTYEDDYGHLHEEKVESVRGDYGRVYDALYDTIVQHTSSVVKEEETCCVMKILERGSLVCEQGYVSREEVVE